MEFLLKYSWWFIKKLYIAQELHEQSDKNVSRQTLSKKTMSRTDKEVFEKFMGWIGMEASSTKNVDNQTVVKYYDTEGCEDRFTKCGYDEFYAGAIFDNEGNIVKAYIDSHVSYTSGNNDEINKILQ